MVNMTDKGTPQVQNDNSNDQVPHFSAREVPFSSTSSGTYLMFIVMTTIDNETLVMDAFSKKRLFFSRFPV